jgi:hypothetical protein
MVEPRRPTSPNRLRYSVMSTSDHPPQFTGDFDDEFPVGAEGNSAYFGRDVLRGLVEGIHEFVEEPQSRWRQFRSLGPAMLASAMWIDDLPLIEKIGTLSGACIVVQKQPHKRRKDIARLREHSDQMPGLPLAAFWQLTQLAPKVNGAPLIVGPGTALDDSVVTAIRAVGYRQVSGRYPPIIHAKLALVGNLWWHDEGPMGNVEDVIGFKPKRLWVSSANFTRQSRDNLEWGYWTEDKALLEGAEGFLVKLMASSEPIDATSDDLDPELAPIEFDDDAFIDYLRDYP